VYLMTMEATVSLWDCGEYISTAYKIQIPHPPGAPLFVLVGRIFVILFGDDPSNAAKAVNTMSAFVSALSILFLFWSITYFAARLVIKQKTTPTAKDNFLIIAAGATGALAYAFSDSFWFSAVEGEVYAFSSFFTLAGVYIFYDRPFHRRTPFKFIVHPRHRDGVLFPPLYTHCAGNYICAPRRMRDHGLYTKSNNTVHGHRSRLDGRAICE
jgi:Protein of unknown function (DUF2723)